MGSPGPGGTAGASRSGGRLAPIATRPTKEPDFERLLAELAPRLANLGADGYAGTVLESIEHLRAAFGYDRVTYYDFFDGGRVAILCSAAAREAERLPVGAFGDHLGWLRAELLAGRVVARSNLPDDLPPEARAERARCLRLGVRSNLSVPLRVAGRTVGALSFTGLTRAPRWTEAVTRRLVIVAEMMATAVARARIEQESRSLRDALWRADRLLRAGTISLAIAHELNQPIAAILTNAQAALRYLDSDRADRTAVRDTIRDALRAIVRDDQRAAETVRAIRRMARRDDGERTSVDLRQVVGEVLVLLQDDLRRAHVKVVLAIEPGLVVRADRVQLQQVALNLIQNATTAMARVAADARTVTIAGCRPDALRVRWSVEDTGPGVAPEHAEAVFEPLQATPADRTGLGLGLSICRKIVELHGGTIRVVEGTDRGARFEIELPAGPDEREPHGQAPSPSREAPAPVGTGSVVPRTVFVVDDDPATREAIARLLRAAGWAVRCIASGREALDDPDLDAVACVLLDVRMEGLSGPQTFEAMRARGVATPVLFLTADDDVRQGVEAIRLGALDYLVKPADPDTLLAAVETAAAARMRIDAAAREGRLRRQRLESLTGRERDVMREVLRGRLNKQIAADLGISEATVKQHRARVMAKMGVRSVAELVHACEGGDPGPSRATVRPAAGPDA